MQFLRHPAERNFSGLPDFFVVGPPRTGTTWLYDVMQGHANLPRVIKETNFFDRRYAHGLGWYRRQFTPLVVNLPIGEIDPTYFYSAEARRRISSVIPYAKIICTLRDPVERLYSLYKLRRASGSICYSFEEAVRRDFEMRESSRYGFHLTAWFEAFGRDRVLVLLYDQLREDPQGYIAEICRFIGIPPFEPGDALYLAKSGVHTLRSATMGRLSSLAVHLADTLNANEYKRTMWLIRKLHLRRWFLADATFMLPSISPRIGAELRVQMRPEVEALEELLRRDLSGWKAEALIDAGPPQ